MGWLPGLTSPEYTFVVVVLIMIRELKQSIELRDRDGAHPSLTNFKHDSGR